MSEMVLSDRYRLEAAVARGGMAEIWRAIDLQDDVQVAVKRLLVGQAPEDKGRLLREAEALRRLSHPNIVRYLDAAFDAEDQPYLVLEWLEGEDLGTRRRRMPLALDELLGVLRQALQGLAACHSQGVLHRDIKPSNIFLVGDAQAPQVKLLDFGLARMSAAFARLTRTGAVMGTLYYLAPEQVRGGVSADHRCDLYSMGVVLYEMVTGRLPFYAEEPLGVMLKIVSETPRWPSQLKPDVPPVLEEAILRAMRRSPADRFQSAEEMLAALNLDAAPTVAVPLSATYRVAFAPTPLARVPTVEQRLVWLLCTEPAANEVSDAECEALREQVARAVEPAGGLSHALRGGLVVGLFGLERISGDEAMRAVRAGLEVRRAIGPRARLLVSTIHVEMSTSLQLKPEDLDRTTRTMATLPVGELVVDDPTRRLVGAHVQLRLVDGHCTVQFLHGDSSGRRAVMGAPELELVGRDSELAALRATLHAALEHREVQAAIIVGPDGMGKSRLLRELLPELEERCGLCLQGHATSPHAEAPFGVLADAIWRAMAPEGDDQTSIRQALEGFLDKWGEGRLSSTVRTAMAEGIGLAGSSDRIPVSAAIDCLAAFLSEVSNRPLALCLEDLQRSDEASVRIVERVLDRLDQHPVFVAITCRPELLERRPNLLQSAEPTQVVLKPLGRRSMCRLVRTILGGQPPWEVEELVLQRCEGNPYFADEILSWLKASELLVRGEGERWELRSGLSSLAMPAGVEAAIQGHLDRLAPELKELLKAAAVFGEVLWEEGCVGLGFPEAGTALRQLQRAELVAPRSTSRLVGATEWAFRQRLVRQVAYQMLPGERRAELHLRAAIWLEANGEHDAGLLAKHFLEGGDPIRAGVYQARAGERALARGDLERAVAHLEAALSVPGLACQERAERGLALSRTHHRLKHGEDALRVLDDLEACVRDPACERYRPECLLLRGQILCELARHAEAVAALEQAADLVDANAEVERCAEVHQTLLGALIAEGRWREAEKSAAQLLEAAQRSGAPDRLCTAKLTVCRLRLARGADLADCVALGEEALLLARRIRHPQREAETLLVLGEALEQVGLYERARSTLELAGALATTLKNEAYLVAVETGLGAVELARGEPSRAIVHYRACSQAAQSLPDRRILATALTGLSRSLCARGAETDLPEASELAQRALDICAGRFALEEAVVRSALAEIALACHDAAEAVAHSQRAVTLLEGLDGASQVVPVLLVAHDAMVAAGREADAAMLLERAERALRARLERISDAVVRSSCAEKVSHHARLLALRGKGSLPPPVA